MSAAKSSDPKTRASGTKKESSDSSHAALQRKKYKNIQEVISCCCTQFCGSASQWCGSGSCFSLWYWSGSCFSLWCGSRSGSYHIFKSDVDPDPDTTFYFDADPDPTMSLTRMWIRIPILPFTLMRIRIQLSTFIKIRICDTSCTNLHFCYLQLREQGTISAGTTTYFKNF